MIQKIAVIGAGTMGHSIAIAFALHGLDVNLYDVEKSVLDRALASVREALQLMADEQYITPDKIEPALAAIHASTDLAETVADREYIIEAAPENVELKRELLARLDALSPADAIFASNTSSLSLESMALGLPPARKARFMV